MKCDANRVTYSAGLKSSAVLTRRRRMELEWWERRTRKVFRLDPLRLLPPLLDPLYKVVSPYGRDGMTNTVQQHRNGDDYDVLRATISPPPPP